MDLKEVYNDVMKGLQRGLHWEGGMGFRLVPPCCRQTTSEARCKHLSCREHDYPHLLPDFITFLSRCSPRYSEMNYCGGTFVCPRFWRILSAFKRISLIVQLLGSRQATDGLVSSMCWFEEEEFARPSSVKKGRVLLSLQRPWTE